MFWSGSSRSSCHASRRTLSSAAVPRATTWKVVTDDRLAGVGAHAFPERRRHVHRHRLYRFRAVRAQVVEELVQGGRVLALRGPTRTSRVPWLDTNAQVGMSLPPTDLVHLPGTWNRCCSRFGLNWLATTRSMIRPVVSQSRREPAPAGPARSCPWWSPTSPPGLESNLVFGFGGCCRRRVPPECRDACRRASPGSPTPAPPQQPRGRYRRDRRRVALAVS